MRSATIFRTAECNLRCKHCGVGDEVKHPRRPLPTIEFFKVIDNLVASGVRNYTFVGGEPTIDKALPDILDYCLSVGASVSLNTNFQANIDKQVACHPAVSSLVVSIDGAEAASHNRVRGRGSFEKILSNLAQVNLWPDHARLEVNFVLNAYNYLSAHEMVDFCLSHEISTLHANIVHPAGFARKNFDNTEHRSELKEAIERIVVRWAMDADRLLLDMDMPPLLSAFFRRKYGISLKANWAACGGLDIYGYVDLRGNHLPCPALGFEESRRQTMNRAVGGLSLIDRPAHEIWKESVFQGFTRSRELKRYIENMTPCNRCEHSETCFPCRSGLMRGEDTQRAELCSLFDTER